MHPYYSYDLAPSYYYLFLLKIAFFLIKTCVSMILRNYLQIDNKLSNETDHTDYDK